jgi:hypothetical protein
VALAGAPGRRVLPRSPRFPTRGFCFGCQFRQFLLQNCVLLLRNPILLLRNPILGFFITAIFGSDSLIPALFCLDRNKLSLADCQARRFSSRFDRLRHIGFLLVPITQLPEVPVFSHRQRHARGRAPDDMHSARRRDPGSRIAAFRLVERPGVRTARRLAEPDVAKKTSQMSGTAQSETALAEYAGKTR